MLRDETEVALNEVLRHLWALAEYYRYAAGYLEGRPADFCRRRAQARARQAEALAGDIRAYGDLPDGGEPESYLLAEMAETFWATLSGDADAAHLRPRLAEERALIDAIDAALARPGLPAVLARSLWALREDAVAATRALEGWLEG